MRIEYFQLIDRILDLNMDEKTISVEAQVPKESTIFEGHFPGYPIMPGVLLIEAMAQTAGWLLLALMNFERMPFLAAVKEAKMRGQKRHPFEVHQREQQPAGGLRHRFDQQDAGHDRIAREMPLENGALLRNLRFDRNGFFVHIQVENAVDQLEILDSHDAL